MNIIVAVDKNWAIGFKNKLLVHIPADQRFFREETTNKVVIMGRKTLESFPAGQPLKNRTNIIITNHKNYVANGAVIVSTIEEAIKAAEKFQDKDRYVIGGASIYEQMLPYCNVAYVTKINYEYEADTYFPNLEKMEQWKLEEQSEEQTYYDLEYVYCKYKRIK